MLNKVSLNNRLREISGLIDRGYLLQAPDRIESEFRELRGLGHAEPEKLVADWRRSHGLPPIPGA